MIGPQDDPRIVEGLAAVDRALDEMLDLPPGDLVVAWVLLAATRNPDGGGDVLRYLSDPRMPPWQVKGILVEAQDDVSFDEYQTPAKEDDH